MKIRLLLFLLIVTLSIFSHFHNQHLILRTEKECLELEKEYQSLKIVNAELKLEFNQLSSRERIEKLALEELAMIYPKHNDQYVHYIKENYRKDEADFSLVDYIIPSVEALNQ